MRVNTTRPFNKIPKTKMAAKITLSKVRMAANNSASVGFGVAVVEDPFIVGVVAVAVAAAAVWPS